MVADLFQGTTHNEKLRLLTLFSQVGGQLRPES